MPNMAKGLDFESKVNTNSSSVLAKVEAICEATNVEHKVENGSIIIFSVGITKRESDLLTKKIRRTLGVKVSFDETYDPDLADENKEDGFILEATVTL